MNKENKSFFNKFSKQILVLVIVLIVLMAFFTLLPSTSNTFLTSKNLLNILRQASTNLYIALAMTMVIILGGIDLSVGSVVALSGCITGGLIAYNNMPVWIGILGGLTIGLIFGVFNGFVISKTTIPPFIVTLATMNIGRGLAYIYTGGAPIRIVSEKFNFIGSGYLSRIPLPVIYLIILTIIALFIVQRTKLGRYIYAVGGNPQAAKYSGINNSRVTFFVYSFAGLMAAISGIVLASRMFSGQPTSGEGAEMDAIAAVVVGGTSMQGGKGTLVGTLIGGMIIAVLSNGLNLMNVNSFWQLVVKGIVILLAVYVDFVRTSREKH